MMTCGLYIHIIFFFPLYSHPLAYYVSSPSYIYLFIPPSPFLSLQKGADPFLINKSGQNALSESYKEGHLHVTYFLKEIARRFKAYFAAHRLSSQLNVACCDHNLNRKNCQLCAVTSSSSSSSSSSLPIPPVNAEIDLESDDESTSVVTEVIVGGIRSSLSGTETTP